jgi:prepilin-type N-terminal cleavage/methylation domain-containing protein
VTRLVALSTRTRRGVTLVELVVVLAVCGILAGVVGLAMRAARPVADTPEQRLAAARREALRTGRPVTAVWTIDGKAAQATARPDGSTIADPALGVDRLTGRSAR